MRYRTAIKLMAGQAPLADETYLSLATDDDVLSCEDDGGPDRVSKIPESVLSRLDPSLQKQTRDIFDSPSSSAGDPVAWEISLGSGRQNVWVDVKDKEGSVDMLALNWPEETEAAE
jgi:hypothetical protein